jgi:hypothetical protein
MDGRQTLARRGSFVSQFVVQAKPDGQHFQKMHVYWPFDEQKMLLHSLRPAR